MSQKECRRPGHGRGLPSALLAAILVLAAAGASCSDPEKTRAEHLSRGEAFLKDKKFQEASLEFRNALQIDERSAPAHWGLARAFEGLEQFPQAADELRRAIQLDPNNLDARVRLGNYYIIAYQQSKDAKLKDEARRLADEVLQKNANHVEAHILLGSILFSEGKRDEALAELNRAVQLDPRRVESLMSLALFYRQTGDNAKAEEIYQRALGTDERAAIVHLEYARFLMQQNRPDRAEEQFRRAVEVDPQSREAHRTLVAFYIGQKQLDRAEQAARAFADLDRDKPEGSAVMADFYAQVGRPDDAVRVFQETISKYPDYVPARYRLGEMLLMRGDARGAQAQADEVLKKNPNDKQALLLRARLRANSGDAKAAIEDLKQVLKQEPHDQAGLYFMADASLRAGQIEQARSYAGDLEKFYPDYLPAKLMQVQINLAAGDWQTAQRQSNELLDRLSKAAPGVALSPELLTELRAKAYTARATTYLQQKSYAAARADFSAARDLQPNSPASYTNLATAALAENKADEAAQHYERALQLDPANFDALGGLTNLYASRKEFDQAHARLDQALAQKPDSAALHFLKGQIYGRQLDARGTEAEMRRALELDPNFVPALNALGALYINTNQPDQAIAQLRQWAERRRDDHNPHVLIGMVEDRRGNFDAACDAYRKALSLKSDDVVASNNLAWDYAEHGKGNLDEAMRLAQGVVQKFPDEPGFADTLGWVYFKKGLYPAAVEQFQKAVDKTRSRGGDSPLYRLHLGQALAAAGRRGEARQQLQQALNAGRDSGLSPEQSEDARRALSTLGG